MMNFRQKQALEFATKIKAFGFRAFLAQAGDYGFVTDKDGTRVMCFGFGVPARLSGTYGPPSRESGTGWSMEKDPSDLRTADDVRYALYAHPPAWAGRGWKYFTTLEQHLKMYGSSSKYYEV